MAQVTRIKQKWRLKRDLEKELRLLTKKKHVFRSIIISLLTEAVDRKKSGADPILVFAYRVRRRGGHSAAYVHELFNKLAFDYSPRCIKPYDDFNVGKIAELEPALKDLLEHDIKIWMKLNDIEAASTSEIRDIQEISKLLDEFYGSTDRIVRAQ
jgi:hypothetical protein